MTRADVQHAVRSTLAIVLAGGRGTRLGALTDNEAKPGMPFGGKFRVVDFPLSNCINSGIRKVAVVTQYRAHTLIRHIQRGWNFLRGELGEFVELWPAQQQTAAGSWYLGTADAIYQNLHVIRQHSPKYVLILAGDQVYRQDYSALIREHVESQADVTVSCVEVPRQEASAFGCVDANSSGWIEGFVEKPAQPLSVPGMGARANASMGIYVFNLEVLLEILEQDARDDSSSHDFGRDIVPSLVGRRRLFAHGFCESCVLSEGATEPYWRDVGTLDAFWEANLELCSVTPKLDLYDNRWPIWTYHEQRPCAKFVFDDNDRRGFAVDSLISAGCVVSGAIVRRSILFTDTRINSYAETEESLLLPRCDVGRRCQLHRAIVAPGCRLPEGLVVGHEPEADDARFYRTPGGVTLVTPKMLRALQ